MCPGAFGAIITLEVGTGDDLTIVDVEAVREGERAAFLDVRLDLALVGRRDVLVGHQHHHHIGRLHRIGDFGDLEAGLLRLVPRRAALAQTDYHLDAGIVEILRVRVALRTVADDRDLPALDEREVGVLFVVNLHHRSLSLVIPGRRNPGGVSSNDTGSRPPHGFETKPPEGRPGDSCGDAPYGPWPPPPHA